MAGGGFGTGLSTAGGALNTGKAIVQSGVSHMETNSFITGMQDLTNQTNEVQLAMGQMNLQKTLTEGFAKFLRESGKGFVQQ